MEHTDKLSIIRSHARRLKLSWIGANVAETLVRAQSASPSYDDFLIDLMQSEVASREAHRKILRYKNARLPMSHDLDQYDFTMSGGLSMTQMHQLRELHWVEAGFNIMLAGPSGVGKTFIAAGLCADAIEHGYRASFRTMDEILQTLRTRDMTSAGRAAYKNLCSSHVIVIDDLMNIIVDREEGNMLFAFINSMYETTSFIITTNRSPAEWAQTIGDEVLATAILDRLLYKCELIQLSGRSYRMANRKTIFEQSQTENKNEKSRL